MMFTQRSLEHEGFYSLKVLAHFRSKKNLVDFSTYKTQILRPHWRHTATAIPFIYSFSGNSAASAPISTFMCL